MECECTHDLDEHDAFGCEHKVWKPGQVFCACRRFVEARPNAEARSTLPVFAPPQPSP